MINPEDGRLLEALRGLRWRARRPPARLVAGAHSSRDLAPAAELAERRAWRQGDEARRIDWKLLARTDRAFIRLAQDQSRMTTMILLDASASMGWPVETLAKWRQTGRIALGLAEAARQAGDPVGATVAQATGSAPAFLRPSDQIAILARIAGLLRGVAPSGVVDLAPFLAACGAQRLVVISDFLGDEAERLPAIAGQFRAIGREVHAIHIVDEAELDPPASIVALSDFRDPQAVRSMDARGRAEYRRRFGEWRTHLAKLWRRQGAHYAMVTSGEPADVAVRRIVRGEA